MTDQKYDEIGVSLKLDRKGRFDAQRVFLREGRVVKRELLTQGRAGAYATKEARISLERIITDWMRGVIEIEQPEAVKVFVE